jgi:metal-sulfur cluster biosynthetic enzyme
VFAPAPVETPIMPSEKEIRKALRTVKDPELNLDLVVLGLVYDIRIDDAHVGITMSLTSPMCPVAGQIVEDAKRAVESVDGVESADVELTFEPLWSPARMDPIIRASLGL